MGFFSISYRIGLLGRVAALTAFFIGLPYFSLSVPPLPAPVPSDFADPFNAYDLGVGGDQHYPANARRFFTNIVATAVGDLDGDGNLDIVALANAIPHNGDYTTAATAFPQFNFRNNNFSITTPFLTRGDALWGAQTNATYNLPTEPNIWVNPPYPNFQFGHFAPPSPNVAAGQLLFPPYVGSDLAWFRGDGRGHFTMYFITPGGAPVRLRMGQGIRLARLRDPAQTGLDIVLTSPCDGSISNAEYHTTTTLRPFSGAGRVMWLQNNGWVGGRLDFTDRPISEYNYDRVPMIFYTGSTFGWEGPAASMNPLLIDVFPIDNDNNDDILIYNMFNLNLRNTNPAFTYSDFPTHDDLRARFPQPNPLPLPQIGDRWFEPNSGFRLSYPLFWYRNTPGADDSRFSTSTYRAVLQDGIDNLHNAGLNCTQFVRLRIGGNNEAYVCTNSGVLFGNRNGVPSTTFFRRIAPATELNLHRTSNQIQGGFHHIQAVDIIDNRNDELVSLDDDGIRIYRIQPRGNDNVTIRLEQELPCGDTANLNTRRFPTFFQVVDLNGDDLQDIIVVNNLPESTNFANTDPATIFIQTRPGRFTKLRQIKPPFRTAEERTNPFSFIGDRGLNPWANISTGDFNRDGLTDFVRTGPKLPMTIFINNMAGLQRARISATVQHPTGTEKTLTIMLGTDNAGGIITISTAPMAIGGIGVHSVPFE